MRVLIVGAAGQLGQAMVQRLQSAHDVIAWGRAQIDLTKHADVRDAIAMQHCPVSAGPPSRDCHSRGTWAM